MADAPSDTESDLGENNAIPEKGDRIKVNTARIQTDNAEVTIVKQVRAQAPLPLRRILTCCASQVTQSGYHPADKHGEPVYIIHFKVKHGGDLLPQKWLRSTEQYKIKMKKAEVDRLKAEKAKKDAAEKAAAEGEDMATAPVGGQADKAPAVPDPNSDPKTPAPPDERQTPLPMPAAAPAPARASADDLLDDEAAADAVAEMTPPGEEPGGGSSPAEPAADGAGEEKEEDAPLPERFTRAQRRE